MNRKPLAFTSIPAWTMPAAAGALSFFETIALADLEGKWVRLSAADQRAILGANVFGKQAFRVVGDGTVEISRSTAFGMDSEIASYDLYAIKSAAAQGKRLSPGASGPSYWSIGEQAIIDALRIAGAEAQAVAIAATKDMHALARFVRGITGESPNWPNMTGAVAFLARA